MRARTLTGLVLSASLGALAVVVMSRPDPVMAPLHADVVGLAALKPARDFRISGADNSTLGPAVITVRGRDYNVSAGTRNYGTCPAWTTGLATTGPCLVQLGTDGDAVLWVRAIPGSVQDTPVGPGTREPTAHSVGGRLLSLSREEVRLRDGAVFRRSPSMTDSCGERLTEWVGGFVQVYVSAPDAVAVHIGCLVAD